MSWTKAEKDRIALLEKRLADGRDYVNNMDAALYSRKQVVDNWYSTLYNREDKNDRRLHKLEGFVRGFYLVLQILGFLAAAAALFGLGALAG
jgi:hypothetical protein